MRCMYVCVWYAFKVVRIDCPVFDGSHCKVIVKILQLIYAVGSFIASSIHSRHSQFQALSSDRKPFLNIQKTKMNYIFSERSNLD